MSLTVYAFALGADKIPKARMYRSGDYGMAFGLNNQTQARRSWQFFHRKEVGLSLLSNSLLVHVDCTALSPQARDDLFMASRDRIADTGFSKTLIEQISKTLKDNPKLKELPQPGTAHHRHHPQPTLPPHPGLHRQKNQRGQDHTRSPALPQTLHHPPALPTPTAPTNHHLTNIEASAACLRRWLPKGTDLNIGPVRLAIIEDHLNTMPRKLHDWHSAHSVYTALSRNDR